jgi:hypothetical protein
MEKSRDELVKEFAKHDDSVFINALITRVAKEKEVKFRTFSGAEHIGFVTGLDHEWVQLTTTDDCAFDMVQIVNIESFTETKNNLRTLNIPEEHKERIRDFALTLYKKAKVIYEKRPNRTSGYYRSPTRVLDEDDYEAAS